LELGVDHPGDMDYLADLVKPSIAVITAAGQAHIGFFGSENNILKEKKKILKYLGIGGIAIINYEDSRLRTMIPEFKHDFISYGFHPACEVRAELITAAFVNGVYGTGFTLSYKQQHLPVFIPGVIGKAHVLAYLAGISVAMAMNLSLEQAVANLSYYNPPPGRMRLLEGINRSLIIDDTYNSSPQAVRLALEELKNFPAGKRKIAVLGDMRELGKFSASEHRNLAESIFNTAPDMVVLVGFEMHHLAKQLLRLNYPKKDLLYFKDSKSAAKAISGLAKPDTVFLVKGSQNIIRMERVVEALLRNKDLATKLLVRQSPAWKRIK
jgi:UDP-N-acetylmuramoyl-tripeptide--D-alanyl-D-alanine ligase